MNTIRPPVPSSAATCSQTSWLSCHACSRVVGFQFLNCAAPTPVIGFCRYASSDSRSSVRRACAVPYSSLLSSVMLASRFQYVCGTRGSAHMTVIAPAIAYPGCRRMVVIAVTISMATNPRKPPRDPVATIAPTMHAAQNAANRRFGTLSRRSAKKIVKGSTDTMFSARSFGFCMIPPTDPITRVPCAIRFTPRT